MAENNSSAPLKTAEGAYPALPKPAYPAQFNGHGGEQSSSEGYSAEQMRAYAVQAVAAQAAPAAPDTNRLRAEILEHASKGSRLVRTLFNEPTGTLSDVEVGDWIQRAQQYLTLHSQAAPAAVAAPDDFELRERWRAAGGSFHGPCVETGTMPEAQLLPFLRDLAATPALPATEDSSAGDLADWRTPTSYLHRFREAITLVCRGKTPPDNMLTEWLAGDSEELQDFAGTHAPAWAQGIGAIEAATVMADQPTEGVEHEFRDESQPLAEVQTEPVASVKRFDFGGYDLDVFRATLETLPPGEYRLYTAPQAQSADALDAAADLWYLQDTRSYVGNDVLWWAKDGNGYTTDISKAHAYPRDEAFQQAAMRGTDRAWPKAYIDGKTRPAVDMQYIDHQAAMAAAQEGGNAAKEA